MTKTIAISLSTLLLACAHSTSATKSPNETGASANEAGAPANEAGAPANEAGAPAPTNEARAPAPTNEAGAPAPTNEPGAPAPTNEAGAAASADHNSVSIPLLKQCFPQLTAHALTVTKPADWSAARITADNCKTLTSIDLNKYALVLLTARGSCGIKNYRHAFDGSTLQVAYDSKGGCRCMSKQVKAIRIPRASADKLKITINNHNIATMPKWKPTPTSRCAIINK